MKIRKLDEEFELGKDEVEIRDNLTTGIAYNQTVKYEQQAEEAVEEIKEQTEKTIDEINDREKGVGEEQKKQMKDLHLIEGELKEHAPKDKSQVYNQDGDVYTMYDFIYNLLVGDTSNDAYKPIDSGKITRFEYISKTLGRDSDDPAGAVGGDDEGLIVYAFDEDRFADAQEILDKYELWYTVRESRNENSKYNYSMKVYYPIDPKTGEIATLVDYMSELGLTPEDVLRRPKHRRQAPRDKSVNEDFVDRFDEVYYKVKDQVYYAVRDRIASSLDNIAIKLTSELPDYEADFADDDGDSEQARQVEYKIDLLASEVAKDLMLNY